MNARLDIPAGAARALPCGPRPWRVTAGEVEAYLVGPDRRRLIAVVGRDEDIFPPADGPLSLSLVATTAATLEEAASRSPSEWLARLAQHIRPEDPTWPAGAELATCYQALDARFAALDAAADARLAASLRADRAGAPQADSFATALIDAAGALGVHIAAPASAGGFATIPALARTAGLRAVQVRLEARSWRDDIGGPLVLQQPDGTAVCLHWARGAWRDRQGAARHPAGFERVGFRIFAPLTHDVSRLAGMARTVVAAVRAESGLIVGAGLSAALAGLAAPLITGWLFDDIVPSGSGGLLVAAGIALFAAGLLSAAFAVVRGLAVARVGGRGQSILAAGLTDHVLRLPARFFRTMSAADLDQRLAGVEAIRALMTNTLLTASLTLVFALTYLVLLFVYEPRMALAGLGLTLVYAVAVAVSRTAQRKPLREAAERDGRMAGLTFEILEGLPKLRSAGAEARIFTRWRQGYAAERAATARGERIAAHFAAFADSWQVVTLMGVFAAAAVLSSDDIPPGRFIAFLAAFGVFQMSFAAFCDSVLALYAAGPAAERARPILTEPAEGGLGRADPGRLTGDIQVSGLSFAYADGSAPLLDGLSFYVRPGEHVAIVGPSGSGKSTVLRLLLGFERPRTGSLTVDGQELSSLDPTRVRAQIGVVLQSSQLFAGTINDNIRGASDASLEQCRLAAERAGLGPDLKRMPMGLHTPVTEGADTLSGGQRQRILIARAIAAEPPILFFDEATSALDNATQAVVARTLDSLSATRVTIAHRLSTVRNADRILVLEQGRFVETGSYSELMARDGAFAALSRRQLLED